MVILSLLFSSVCGQTVDQYRILKLSDTSATIQIGTKYYKQGAVFRSNEVIHWNPKVSSMRVQNMKSKQSRVLTAAAFHSKNANSIADYVRLSGKDGVPWGMFGGKNRDLFTERRIALVIGNANYTYHTLLQNPQLDAEMVANELRELGFDVMTVYDGNKEDMNKSLHAFVGKAKDGRYDMAVVYYSGHGMQYGGQNWLLPVDANIFTAADALQSGLSSTILLQSLKESKCKNIIVMLDACRSMRLSTSPTVVRTGELPVDLPQGMAAVDPPKGVCIAFATRSGEIAQDDVQDNNSLQGGPYANALVEALKVPNLTIDELFNQVKEQVMKVTNRSQMPIHTNALLNTRLYINGQNVYTIERNVYYAPSEMEADVYAMALTGNKEAQFELGQDYEYGLNDRGKDQIEAFRWYLLSARQGFPKAQNKIGNYYFAAGDYENAMDWFQKAAIAGNPNAQYNAGYMCSHSEYGLVSKEMGRKWLELAADNEVPEAQFELGKCYYHGVGVMTYSYPTKAVEYFKRAADQGHIESCYYLGLCYYNGEGVAQNYSYARHFFEEAANAGHADAQYYMCDCYANGQGVPKADNKIALSWCEKAAKQGHVKAKRKLPYLRSNVD